jgi:hypothetical protein
VGEHKVWAAIVGWATVRFCVCVRVCVGRSWGPLRAVLMVHTHVWTCVFVHPVVHVGHDSRGWTCVCVCERPLSWQGADDEDAPLGGVYTQEERLRRRAGLLATSAGVAQLVKDLLVCAAGCCRRVALNRVTRRREPYSGVVEGLNLALPCPPCPTVNLVVRRPPGPPCFSFKSTCLTL